MRKHFQDVLLSLRVKKSRICFGNVQKWRDIGDSGIAVDGNRLIMKLESKQWYLYGHFY